MLIFVFGDSFIDLWVGSEFGESKKILMILMLGSLFSTTFALNERFLTGTGKQGTQVIFAITEGVVGISISVIAGLYYGLVGIAVGYLTGIIFLQLIAKNIYIIRSMNLSIKNFLKSNFIESWSICGCIYLLDRTLDINFYNANWNLLVLAVTLYSTLFLLTSFYVVLNKYERNVIISKLIQFK
jgi:O-antigen/teichoic acid export membrane protein